MSPSQATVVSMHGRYGSQSGGPSAVHALDVDDLDAEHREHRRRVRSWSGPALMTEYIDEQQRAAGGASGRHPERGLTPRSLYSSICAWLKPGPVALVALLELLELRLDAAASAAVETIWRRKSGMRSGADDEGQDDDRDRRCRR